MAEDVAPGTMAVPAGKRMDPVWRDRLIIGLAYALAWGMLVVNRGIYWDDWTGVGVTPESMAQGFREIGTVPWIAYFFVALYSTPVPGLVGHILAFAVYLLSTLLLHGILCRTPGLSRMDALVAALVFAVLPVNYARIALVDLPYGLSLLAFMAATWLLVRHVEDGGLPRRLAALGLYLVSFFTASLLVLYVAPMALAAFIAWKSARVSPLSFAARHADFIALPIVYWLFKSAFFLPTGAYAGYNALTAQRLAQVPAMLLAAPTQVLFEPLYRAVTVGGLLGVVAGVVAAAWLLRRSRAEERGSFVSAPALALVGVAVLVLGVFPYLAVDKAPVIWDWSSRHQLLVPLGVGLLAAAALRGVRGARRIGPALGVTVGLLIGISAVADARTLAAYQADWFKQTALIEAARKTPELRDARHITVIDSATEFNTLRRWYRFYEYNALFSMALGDTRRLASDGVHEPSPEQLDRFIARPAYHMGEYVPAPVDLELLVSSRQGRPGVLQLLRLVVLEAIGSPAFEEEVSRLIDVKASPVVATPSDP